MRLATANELDALEMATDQMIAACDGDAIARRTERDVERLIEVPNDLR